MKIFPRVKMSSFSALATTGFAARAAIVAAPLVTAGVLLYSRANRDWYKSLHHPSPRVSLTVHVVVWIVVAIVLAWTWNRLAVLGPLVDLLFLLVAILQTVAVYLFFGQKELQLTRYVLVATALLLLAVFAMAWYANRTHAILAGVAAIVYALEAFQLFRTYH